MSGATGYRVFLKVEWIKDAGHRRRPPGRQTIDRHHAAGRRGGAGRGVGLGGGLGGNVGLVSETLPLRLVLASASPARRKLLQAAGVEPEVLVSGVDESLVVAERAEELCLELARLKAQAVSTRLNATADQRTLVIGCDSVLAFDGEILGKPADAADATRRWRRMRGRSGVLHSGHCLIDVAAGRRAEAVASTTVALR